MENNFINQNKNDLFSNFRGLDLQELIVNIENFYLEYRSTLNLPDYVSFGVKIEYEGENIKNKVDRFIERKLPYWKSKTDESLNSGGEIESAILYDNSETWLNLKKVCEFLKDKNVDTFHKAGGHIHFGKHILGSDFNSWYIFLKTYVLYENVISRFVYNDKLNYRNEAYRFAKLLSNYDFILNKLDKKKIKSKDIIEILNWLKSEKFRAIRLKKLDLSDIETFGINNTIEFRRPNATIEEVIWQNNINMLAKLLLSAKNHTIDLEFVEYKYKKYKTEFNYNVVNLKDALEFVDLIFDNNLDKVYFLRQYFKNFQDGYNLDNIVSAKKFIK